MIKFFIYPQLGKRKTLFKYKKFFDKYCFFLVKILPLKNT
ncbi:hypothetical protein Rain11_0567 [Raineya orbicola]|uniref:Uncharacterized protein n=1 Tax=Raineya orbicola TaxID=2016530 RepID=A0A2N3IJ43_9BACT|nr:hypothetical protein Rain11_0567 [Raineya orbicola]